MRKYYWDWRLCLTNLSLLGFCLICWLAVFLLGKMIWEAYHIEQMPTTTEYHKLVMKPEKTEMESYLEKVFSKYKQAQPEKYAKWVVKYSKQYNLPPKILAGMILQESSGNPKAHNKSDPGSGSRGLTQVCWKWWGKLLRSKGVAMVPEDLFNPEKSIHAGAVVLRNILDQHSGNMERAMKHYSGGSTRYYAKIQARVVL